MSKQLHQQPRSEASLSDEYETPLEVYDFLCKLCNLEPNLDVCATKQNRKCHYYFSIEADALTQTWMGFHPSTTVWCNPPHSKTEEFVRKAYAEWMKNNIEIMMLIPANTMSSKYWHECIEENAYYYPIKGRIKFLVNGEKSKFASRNAYVCVVWRERNEI